MTTLQLGQQLPPVEFGTGARTTATQRVTISTDDTVQLTGNYASVAPVGQLSTASTVVLAGCEFDARTWTSLAYTISVITNDVTWSVWGANAANYSDESAVLTATSVVAATNSNYVVSLAPFSFYRVKIIDTVGASHGTATVRGGVKS